MEPFLGPKFFLSTAFFLITIISIYGIVGAVYNHIQINQRRDIGNWPFNIRPLFQAFTIIQSLFPLVGLFALICACKKNPLFLFGSGSILLAIFTCSSIFGIVSYRVAPSEILESIYKTFRQCSNDSKSLEWMNDVQSQYRCCGVYNYLDWYATDIQIPNSCCRHDIPHNRNCSTIITSVHGKANGAKDSATTNIYHQGCGAKLTNSIRESLEQLSLEMCICGGVSLLMAIFLYVGVTRFFLTAKTAGSSSSKSSAQPPTISRKRSREDANMNDDHDANNNTSGNQQRRFIQWRQKRQSRGPFAPIQSQAKTWSSSLRRDISKSKSFILGDVPSQSLTPIFEENDTEILRKNVDMLYYQSLDKNMSTLSTTPNDLSAMLLSTMISQSKRQGPGNDSSVPMSDDEAFALRNTVYTIVGERPFTASLSQNCSSSLFNGNQIKQSTANGDTIDTAQNSPHCLSNKIRHAQKVPALYGDVDEISEEEEDEDDQTIEHVLPQGPISGQFIPETITREQVTEEKGNDEVSLSSSVNAVTTGTGHLTTPNSKYSTTTSSVRSSTLATIQEESESAKGSPANTKAASPASGCLTPEAISPQQTQTKLFPNPDKDNIAIHCGLELIPSNNNNLNCNVTVSDVQPECSQ